MLFFSPDCGCHGALWCFVRALKAVSLSGTFPFALLSLLLAISAAVVMLLERLI